MIEVTCAIILSENKILVTQNGDKSDHPHQWEFPGGKCEPEETLEQCVRREILEELELHIHTKEELAPVAFDYGIKQIKLFPFICEIKNGTMQLNNHIAAQWVSPEELSQINFSGADNALIHSSDFQQKLQKHIGK